MRGDGEAAVFVNRLNSGTVRVLMLEASLPSVLEADESALGLSFSKLAVER